MPLPHEHAAEASAWAQSWEEILAERDRMSCLQAGRRGPPFAANLSLASQLERWLPWNWYSLDGRGWCYDAEWDELVRCDDLERHVDWNGISRPALYGASQTRVLPPARLALFCCVAFVLLSYHAYREWELYERKVRMGGAPPSPYQWIRSREIAPWRWELSARLALLGALCAFCVSPLISLPDTGMS